MNKPTGCEEDGTTIADFFPLPDYFFDDYELDFDLDGVTFRIPDDFPININTNKTVVVDSSNSRIVNQERPRKLIRFSDEDGTNDQFLDLVGAQQDSSLISCFPSSSSSSVQQNNRLDMQVDNKTTVHHSFLMELVETIEPKKCIRVSECNRGENRLQIGFISLGKSGEVPQGFGRKHRIIPDGLLGTNVTYHERWQFEVVHHKKESGVITIEWKITNLSSGTITTRTETLSEAILRQTRGKTICNLVVREALDKCALELETSVLLISDNPLRIANLQSRAKALRPKRCLIGLLFFGLLHEAVQEQ